MPSKSKSSDPILPPHRMKVVRAAAPGPPDPAPGPAAPGEGASPREKVEWAVDNKHWTISRIADYCNLSPGEAFELRRRVVIDRARAILEAPEEVQLEHAFECGVIYRAAMECFYAQPRKARKSEWLRAALMAMADQRRIHGLDAPSRSLHVQVSADATREGGEPFMDLVDDPESRRLILALEDRQRQIRAERPDDVPGRIRRRGERRSLARQAPPPADERDRLGGGGGPDQETIDIDTPAGREVRILEQMVPGLVSRRLPGSEGDPGLV